MLVILDRDGVINYDSPDYIKSPAEWKALPDSLEAITRLKQAGHKVVVATNQSGVARGYFSLATLAAIHHKMAVELAQVGGATLDGIFVCPHGPDDNCECRKPKPGLFTQIAHAFPQEFPQAVAIGDSLRDVQAAQAAGCAVWLVKTGNGQSTLAKHPQLTVPVFKDLAAAVATLLAKETVL